MNTKIIAIANQKGGCGKTTVTMHLAGALGLDGYKIQVIDADKQGTATRWASSAAEDKPFPAVFAGLSNAGEKVHREVKKYIGEYDFIIIDCPPAVESPIPQSALMISDLVIVPIIPSPADVWASVGMQQLIERMKDINETLEARVIANMCQITTNLNEEVINLLKEKEFGIKKLEANICLRTSYRQCQLIGGTVFDLEDTGSKKAITEVKAFKNEVLSILKIKNKKKK